MTCQYDTMGRPNRMTEQAYNPSNAVWQTRDVVSEVQYGPGGEMRQMRYGFEYRFYHYAPLAYFVDTRQYNSTLQMTRRTVACQNA